MIFDKDKFKYVDHILKDPKNPEGPGVREIIALAKYNGKTYRGSAKCHPEDTFDFTIGQEIAARRCDLLIRRVRLRDRARAEDKAIDDYNQAKKLVDITSRKSISATNELIEAQEAYNEYIKNLMGS